MICYTLCTIGDITQTMLRYKTYLTYSEWDSSEAYLVGTKNAIYHFGNIIFFILLFMKIKIAFQISKLFISYLSLLLIIFSIVSIIYCITLLDAVGKSIPDEHHTLSLISYPLSITDFLLNMSLFILFIYKIKNKDIVKC